MLEDFRVGSLANVCYIPDYITAKEEQRLAERLCCCKTPWTEVSGRRLKNYGGRVHDKSCALLQAPLPGWLEPLLQRLSRDTQVFGPGQQPNHVLLNAYKPGQGIMPHQDGPLYHPGVCILSMGSPTVMHFTRKCPQGGLCEGRELSVALMPRSLLIFSGEAYEQCLHGIDAAPVHPLHGVCNRAFLDRDAGQELMPEGERFSLTVRRVLKVRSLLR
ncbi:g8583 [Coccomyxa viridis]|uniref:G8583 protein n=1 Tax=Coccomyxa viridis TaxID=1274662 RepID=A0ABP1G4V8_9CHLO